MEKFLPTLAWIESQKEPMLTLLEQWANINSGSDNLNGLALMLSALRESFRSLGGNLEELSLLTRKVVDERGHLQDVSHGKALHIRKYEEAPIKVLLGGHMDTVFPRESPFQKTTHIDANTLNGPGVVDMKGGLVVLLYALQSLEKSPFAGKIGWEVLINSDEEIGSIGSESLWIAYAKRNDLGLIFEPAFFDGSLVSSRKGSSNFTLVARGRAAHAGRDFYLGRSAIAAMSRFICQVESLNNKDKGITLNFGQISGGTAVNIVPDLCICRCNIRVIEPQDLLVIVENLQHMIAQINKEEGLSLSLYPHHSHPPKLFDEKNKDLFEKMALCAKEIGIELQTKPSGGACDGNTLSYEGLPVIDSLGVVGGKMHTYDEYMLISSLVERTQLTALFLMKLAAGEIKIPQRS